MFDIKCRAVVCSAFVWLSLALPGCGGGSAEIDANATAQCADGEALVICGTPSTSLTQGLTYSFVPTTGGGNGATLTFTITDLPPWANFNSNTGALTGTPDVGDIGAAFTGFVISVTDGETSASLPAFGITVLASSTGAATLSWMPPTENEDMTPLTDLAGYKIYYGQAIGNYQNPITIDNPGVTTSIVENLSPGPWHFVVTAFDTSLNESVYSNVASTTISEP